MHSVARNRRPLCKVDNLVIRQLLTRLVYAVQNMAEEDFAAIVVRVLMLF